MSPRVELLHVEERLASLQENRKLGALVQHELVGVALRVLSRNEVRGIHEPHLYHQAGRRALLQQQVQRGALEVLVKLVDLGLDRRSDRGVLQEVGILLMQLLGIGPVDEQRRDLVAGNLPFEGLAPTLDAGGDGHWIFRDHSRMPQLLDRGSPLQVGLDGILGHLLGERVGRRGQALAHGRVPQHAGIFQLILRGAEV
eukprot:scaffold1166_cov261-Pinguiococcus_pyrenoidosus.AAC.47